MYIVSALSGARSQEFHSPRHMCCDVEGCIGFGLPLVPRDPTQISRERAVASGLLSWGHLISSDYRQLDFTDTI